MAGLFPGICNSQNVDRNGQPLASAMLTVYQGGTLTLADTFQDIGLSVPSQNPMTADQTGRLPLFYVADGVYRVILTDQYGVSVYDYSQVASIGAATSGGGGATIDPTTIFQTGDELWKKIGGARTGWVRQNALTIGSATSGASERANADCQNLFYYLWNNYPDAKCPVVTGRGVSAAADFAANKQITLPDMRGRSGIGLDGMGNLRANVLPDSAVTSPGDTGDTDAASGGAALNAIAQANLPNISFVITGTAAAQVVSIDIVGIAAGTGALNVFAPGGSLPTSTGITVADSALTGNAASGGSGTDMMTIGPFAIGTWYLKL